MAIFSATTRTDPSPASHGDGQFQFLDRVSGPYWDQVRDLVEDWFSHLSREARSDVRGRLRSKDDRQFKGAFFELYLHECLLRMGYSVTCHPQIQDTSRRPDFLAEKDGRSIYVEARSASPSDVAVGKSARLKTVFESLDKVNSSNFFLWIEVEKQGDTPLRARPLRSRVERWLAGLDPDEYSLVGKHRDDLPGLTHEDAGWTIDLRALPRSPASRGRPGARLLGIFGGGEANRVRDEEGIRGALTDKGSAYGTLGAPFVVAVASNSVIPDDRDVLNALYGTEAVQLLTFADGAESAVVTRKPDGYWNGMGHWTHRGVSAVLVVKNLHPALVGGQQHTIWEHPRPDDVVDPLPVWRRAVLTSSGSVSFVEPARSQTDWFGLSEPWPVGSPFPRA